MSMEYDNQKVSVIVPVYNAQAYLLRCVFSILNQRHRELELILVDDGSSDCSSELCDEIAKWDARVKVVHQDNWGISSARNAGLAVCTGDYIHFVDSDDWIDENLYEIILPQITRCNADVAFFGWVFETATKKAFQSANARNGVGNTYDLMHDMLLQVGNPEGCKSYSNYVWNKIFKRDLVIKDGMPVRFDESLSVAEDLVWLLDVVPYANVGVFDNRSFYHYVLNTKSVTKSSSNRVSSWLQSQSVHKAVLEWLLAEGQHDLYEIHQRSCVNFWTSNYKSALQRGASKSAALMLQNIMDISGGNLPENILDSVGKTLMIYPKYKRQAEILKTKRRLLSYTEVKAAVKVNRTKRKAIRQLKKLKKRISLPKLK